MLYLTIIKKHISERIVNLFLLYISLIVLFLVGNFSFGQSPKDSCLKMHLVCMQIGGQIPGGDLAARFAENLNVGLSYFLKTKNNLVFGVDPHYFFGRKIKEDVLAPLKTAEGSITNTDGNFGNIKINERGWLVTVDAGKIITRIGKIKAGPNPNSGIFILGGIGYMQHRIFILNQERNVPQVSSQYLKGYDRLTAGVCAKEFIGYFFLSNNRLLNFFGGFEFYQGFTKSMRSYNYDLMMSDTQLRTDLLYGIRVGWVLPIYKRSESDNLFLY